MAFHTDDPEQIDRLFRASGLMREKWDEKHYGDGRTYGEEVVRKAVDSANNRRQGSGRDCDLPPINAQNQHLPSITLEAWDALIAANEPPKIFAHATGLVRLEHDEKKGLLTKTLYNDHLRHVLARVASWYKKNRDDDVVDARPPLYCVRDMLVDPEPPLPYLLRIVQHPIFATDKTLHIDPGYLESTRCYYQPDDSLIIPDVPETPTDNDLEKARVKIDDLLSDFPFTSEAETAHAVALLILPFVRYLIPGPTPLHLFEAPSPGSGKTLCASAVAYPALGRPIPSMTEGKDEEEYRKRVTSALRNGPAFVFLDNVRRRLDSSALSSAITSRIWEDRILGKSVIVRLPISCAWVATGNNPSLSSEMTRRTIRIRLDPKMDRPWTRDSESFRHPRLLEWTKENRGELIWAALTMAQAWIADDCPKPENKAALGMFEEWCHVIGGILQVAGINGFLENLNEFYKVSDAEGETVRSFINSWWDEYQQKEVGVSELYTLIDQNDMPLDLGRSTTEKGQKIYLGKFLSNLRDRQFDNYRVTAAGTRQRANLWKLSPIHIQEVIGGSSFEKEDSPEKGHMKAELEDPLNPHTGVI
jgi:hypothetical protein